MLGSRRRLGRGGDRAVGGGGESERRRDVLWWRLFTKYEYMIRYLVLRVEGSVGCACGMIV